MRFGKTARLFVLLMASGEFSTIASHAAGQKDAPAHNSGRSSWSMEKKSSGNNEGWQADPERGWVRSDEPRNQKDQRNSAKQNGDKKPKQGKHNKWFF
ncbi:MAG TPA: hypothetical protein VGA27_14670 [Candidatus Binatia bacterium]|jgi:hypothetical protein